MLLNCAQLANNYTKLLTIWPFLPGFKVHPRKLRTQPHPNPAFQPNIVSVWSGTTGYAKAPKDGGKTNQKFKQAQQSPQQILRRWSLTHALPVTLHTTTSWLTASAISWPTFFSWGTPSSLRLFIVYVDFGSPTSSFFWRLGRWYWLYSATMFHFGCLLWQKCVYIFASVTLYSLRAVLEP